MIAIPIANTSERQSNFELLRVIAMSAIIIHHFFYHAITEGYIGETIYKSINPFLYIGVNLFFLISGWFGIRFNLRRLFTLILLVFFYDVINVALCFATKHPLPVDELVDQLFWPVSQSPYWFLQVYMLLLIAAPLINAAIEALSLKQFRYTLLLLTIATVYSCSMGDNISNQNGTSFLQAMYLYLVGRYLHIDKRMLSRLRPAWCVLGFFLLLAVEALIILHISDTGMDKRNSVTHIGATVLLLIAFSKMRLRSRVVNVMGVSSVGCYMLHDGLFGTHYIYPRLHTVCIEQNLGEAVAIFTAAFAAIWFIAVTIHPPLKRLAKLITSLFSNIIH